MRQVLMVGARLFAASVAPAAVRAPAPTRNGISLGFVLGDPAALMLQGLGEHHVIRAHVAFSPTLAAIATDRRRDLWGLLRRKLVAPLRFHINLALGACCWF